jgi:FkbM family methyltransferase
MVDFFDLIDRTLRRNSRLPRMLWLRNFLRVPYHKLLSIGSSGLPLKLGGVIPVRVPVEFCCREQQLYEAESLGVLKKWIDEHPGSVFVDIGCSYGYMSCAALFSDLNLTAIAVDADLESLAITRRVCSLAKNSLDRIVLVRTLVGPVVASEITISQLSKLTEMDLLQSSGGDPRRTNYVNLDSTIAEDILKRTSIDQMVLPLLEAQGRPCLIKCDVEGAEQSVLEGALKTMASVGPTWLMSVHPFYLEKFGGSREGIEQIFRSAGYSFQIVATDHEEHWLAQKNSTAAV